MVAEPDMTTMGGGEGVTNDNCTSLHQNKWHQQCQSDSGATCSHHTEAINCFLCSRWGAAGRPIWSEDYLHLIKNIQVLNTIGCSLTVNGLNGCASRQAWSPTQPAPGTTKVVDVCLPLMLNFLMQPLTCNPPRPLAYTHTQDQIQAQARMCEQMCTYTHEKQTHTYRYTQTRTL